MKKTIAMLLVAMLTVGSVFAAFTGEATLGAGVNLDTKEYGFIDKGTSVTFDFELGTESGENVGEGDIYASIKGTFGLTVLSTNKGIAGFDDEAFENSTDRYALGIDAVIDEAKVYGENWYVSILGVPGGPDFAKSAIDTYKKKDNTSYDVKMKDTNSAYTWSVPYFKAPGVEVGVADYKFGFGYKATATRDNLFSGYQVTAYAATPEFDFDGITTQVAAVYSAQENEKNAVGASLKLGFANDTLTASVATDLGYDFEAEKFGMDVAANVVVSGITIDGYYAITESHGGDNYLSARVKADLNEFDVPVALTVTGKDLINKQDLDASVEFAIGDVTLTPCVGYVIKDEKFNAGIAAEYTHEYFTLSAETNITTAFKDNDLVWDAAISLENDTLIPGATLSLAWAEADDILKNDADADTKLGSITASITMSF